MKTLLAVMLIAAFSAEASEYSFTAKDCILDRFTYTDAEMWIAFTGSWLFTNWRPDQSTGDRYRGVDRYFQLKRPEKYSDLEWKAFCEKASGLLGKRVSIWFGYSGVFMAHGERNQVHLLHLGNPLERIEITPSESNLNEKKNTERARPANPRRFGTSGMAPAGPASRAGAMPEASGDS